MKEFVLIILNYRDVRTFTREAITHIVFITFALICSNFVDTRRFQ